ncbi:MAG: type II toxin-antitoxin system VapC family toxin [Zoogloeaceae bacterium]|jgi:predicted nucleic acid-binding protein|nr:type II toxin-antitoxin system VapC family toxin [Zoogloeaceae bacterium]
MRLYLDSCVLIHFVERQNPQYAAAIAEALQQRRVLRPVVCWTHLTRMECRVKPVIDKNTVSLLQFETFFARPDTECLALTLAVFDLATELRARHRLKTPDALHLATAIQAGCEEFWTNDHRLDMAAGNHLKTVTL